MWSAHLFAWASVSQKFRLTKSEGRRGNRRQPFRVWLGFAPRAFFECGRWCKLEGEPLTRNRKITKASAVAERVFLSYSREDASTADQIRSALEAAGHNVWVDTARIQGGDQWRASIVALSLIHI